MSTKELQEEYVGRMNDLYNDITKDPDPGEDGVQSPFQKLILNVWEIFQNLPYGTEDVEKDARAFIEGFLANPVSPFNANCKDPEIKAVLKEVEPRFIEEAKQYYALCCINWNKIAYASTSEEARSIAERFLNSKKVNLGLFGQISF